jgi:hypothetical protein
LSFQSTIASVNKASYADPIVWCSIVHEEKIALEENVKPGNEMLGEM